MTGGQGVLSPGQRMVCGLGAGTTEAVLVVTWIETLKVRLIADQKKPKPRFRGLCHAAATIVREELSEPLKQCFESSLDWNCLFSGFDWYLQGRWTHSL